MTKLKYNSSTNTQHVGLLLKFEHVVLYYSSLSSPKVFSLHGLFLFIAYGIELFHEILSFFNHEILVVSRHIHSFPTKWSIYRHVQANIRNPFGFLYMIKDETYL